MKRQKSNKTLYILGLVLIVVVYSCFAIFFVDFREEAFIPRKLRHAISLVLIVIQYLVGFIFLRKLSITWMKKVWNIIYVSGLIIICAIGLYDWLILSGRANQELSMFARTIQELLMAPVLYVVMGLLQKALFRNTHRIE